MNVLQKDAIITIRVSKRHKAKLQAIADENGCTLSDLVNTAIHNYLQNSKRRQTYKKNREQNN